MAIRYAYSARRAEIIQPRAERSAALGCVNIKIVSPERAAYYFALSGLETKITSYFIPRAALRFALGFTIGAFQALAWPYL
jgi:hypothetical protein